MTLTSTAWGSQGHTAGCPPGITFKDLRKERPRAPALCSPGQEGPGLALRGLRGLQGQLGSSAKHRDEGRGLRLSTFPLPPTTLACSPSSWDQRRHSR